MSRGGGDYTCCVWVNGKPCNSWSSEPLQPGERWWAKTSEIGWARVDAETPRPSPDSLLMCDRCMRDHLPSLPPPPT